MAILKGSKHIHISKTGIWASNGEMKIGDIVEKKDGYGGTYRAVVSHVSPATYQQYYMGSVNLYANSMHNANEYIIVGHMQQNRTDIMPNHEHIWQYIGKRPKNIAAPTGVGYMGECEFVCSCGEVKLTLPKELK